MKWFQWSHPIPPAAPRSIPWQSVSTGNTQFATGAEVRTRQSDAGRITKTRRPTETFSWLITPLGWHARSVPGRMRSFEPA